MGYKTILTVITQAGQTAQLEAAVALARRIRDRLVAAGVSIAPFHEAAR